MRVLFVSSSFPRDLRTYVSGSYQRMNLFIEAIKEVAQLDLLFYVPPDVDISASAISALERKLAQHWDADIRLFLCSRFQTSDTSSKWNDHFTKMFSFFQQESHAATSRPQQIQALESCLEHSPDLVFAYKLSSMCPLLLTRRTLPPVLFDLDDIEHIAFFRGIQDQWRWRYKLLQYSRLPALVIGERRAIHLANRTFVCSELDRRYLADRWKLPNIEVIPNAITNSKHLPVTCEPTLLLLAAYWYQPNVEAAEFLIGEIWPLISRAVPSAKLIVAGSRPEAISAYSEQFPGVEFAGFVDNLENLYRCSRVVCCPILRGGGTRVKIIEAAAYGKPIVATHIGAEGLGFRNGAEILLRDDARSFANACIELLTNDSLCDSLGSAAYETAVQHYNRARIKTLIRTHVMAACNEGPASVPTTKQSQHELV